MDSYFGVIGHSFYGGPNGQSFRIAYIFNTRKAMQEDLSLGFASSLVQVGEYAIVSYGDPNDESYQENREIDFNRYGAFYNATLWQKIYDPNDSSGIEGLVYKLITNFETTVPTFTFTSDSQDPGSWVPSQNHVRKDQSSTEFNLKYILTLPNPWNIALDTYTPVNPDVSPSVTINGTTATKYIHFSLPKAWQFTVNDIVPLSPGDSPSVGVVSSGDTKYITFSLPKAWGIISGGAEGGIAPGSGTSPQVIINNIKPDGTEDPDNKYVYFELLDPWDIDKADDTGYINPGEFNEDLHNIYFSEDAAGTIKLLHFKVPKAWEIDLGNDSGSINPTDSAFVSIDRKLNPSVEDSDTTKYVHIKIPNAWQIASDYEVINPGVSPSVIMDDQGEDPTTTKYVHFKLPKAWNVELGNITLLTPLGTPDVQITNNNDTKYIHFALPRAQVFQENAFTIKSIGPKEEAIVVTTYSDETQQFPRVELDLPRAAITNYGNALSAKTNLSISRPSGMNTDPNWDAVSNLLVGDFYINTTLGAVHEITDKTTNLAQTTCRGSLQLQIPTIIGNSVSPYESNGDPYVPKIVADTAVDSVGNWNITVDTVKAPKFTMSDDSGFIASTETGTINANASNDTVTYTIKIPKGTRVTTAGEMAKESIVNPMNGDLYIDTSGYIWKYTTTGSSSGYWSNQDWSISLKGEGFKLIPDSAVVVEESTLVGLPGDDIYQKIGYYFDHLDPKPSYASPNSNEIVNINLVDSQNNITNYWLYKGPNTWTGDQLTGTIDGTIIVNTSIETTGNIDNKAYSVTQINALRQIVRDLESRVTDLEEEIAKGWGTLGDLSST